MVPPGSYRVSRVRQYSGTATRGGGGFAYGALTLCGGPSQALPLPAPFLTPPQGPGPGTGSPQPPRGNALGLALAWVWAGARSLAATGAISVDFSSSGYLDVSVPPVVSARPMYSGGGAWAWPHAGSPIRRPADRRLFAPARRLSQLAASFIDFLCQGIRRAPLISSPGPAHAPHGLGPMEQILGHNRLECLF